MQLLSARLTGALLLVLGSCSTPEGAGDDGSSGGTGAAGAAGGGGLASGGRGGAGLSGAGLSGAGLSGAGLSGAGLSGGGFAGTPAPAAGAGGTPETQTGGATSVGGLPAAGGSAGSAGGTGGLVGGVGGSGGGLAPPACTGAPVKATQSGAIFTLDNGLVKATIDTSKATVPSFVFKGLETMQTGGYFSFGTNVYTAGPFKGGFSADPAQNNGELAEVAMTTKWNGAATVVPLDLEVRFALPRCSQGLYEYVVLTHPNGYPAFSPGEMRINHYIRLDLPFDWYAVDDTRRGPFLSQADETASQAVPGAPVEVRKYVTGPFANRPGWQKYDATIEWGEGNVYGWSSSTRKIGLWLINPSNEYLSGGPMKTELTVHPGGSGRGALLNYWGGSHFYGKLEPVTATQQREKVLGPWLLYANSTALDGAAGQDALWADAKQRLSWEKAAWPYAWEKDPRYPAKGARGSVQGRLSFSDPQQPMASVGNAWVGLAGPPVAGAPRFEHQGWDYQYWVRADAQGNFTLANVRPGNYTLHAFVAGIHGVHMGAPNAVTVAAGGTLSLGTVAWVPDRRGPTVWEIGTPDRTPKEFLRGDQAWHYGTHLLFSRDFPNGVNYVVGTSTPAKDWSYMQPGGTWNVQFTLASMPANASAASLVLDVAGSDGATVRASLNGTPVGSASFPYDDGSIDRDQPHGVLQSGRIALPLAQLRTGANTLALAATGRLMWDYVRLEWVTP